MTDVPRLEIDHAIAVVADLDAASTLLIEEHGLASLPGGRHPGHGTGNRVVPLGSAYLELMAVIDPDEAAGSPLGRWAQRQAREDLVPRALCLRTDDIGAIADLIDAEPLTMSRLTPDGARLEWTLAGLDGLLERALPFFIEWHVEPSAHPGAAVAPHRVEPRGVEWVELGVEDEVLSSVLSSVPGVRIGGPPPGLRVAIATARGEVLLGA